MTSFPPLAAKDESTARDAEGSDSRSEIGFVKRPPSHRQHPVYDVCASWERQSLNPELDSII